MREVLASSPLLTQILLLLVFFLRQLLLLMLHLLPPLLLLQSIGQAGCHFGPMVCDEEDGVFV